MFDGDEADLARREQQERSTIREAFRTTFFSPGPASEIVRRHLARFCCADGPTVRISPMSRTIDPLATVMAEGRREVWLAIHADAGIDPITGKPKE